MYGYNVLESEEIFGFTRSGGHGGGGGRGGSGRSGRSGQGRTRSSSTFNAPYYPVTTVSEESGSTDVEAVADQVLREMGMTFGALEDDPPFQRADMVRTRRHPERMGNLPSTAPRAENLTLQYAGLPSVSPRAENLFPRYGMASSGPWSDSGSAPSSSGTFTEALKLGAGLGIGFLAVGLGAGLLARAIR